MRGVLVYCKSYFILKNYIFEYKSIKMKKIDKKEVLQIAIQKQQELTENYTQRVSDMNADSFSRNASASQTEDRHSNKLDVLQALEKELDFAQKEWIDRFLTCS